MRLSMTSPKKTENNPGNTKIILMDINKPVSQLTINDFENHPIWTWVDDDGEMVCPIQDEKITSEKFDSVFVYCKMSFNDGTIAQGAIAVRLSDHSIYMVDISYKNRELISIPLQPLQVSYKETQLKKLCAWYSKELSSIFPIRHETSLTFNDNSLLVGIIDL